MSQVHSTAPQRPHGWLRRSLKRITGGFVAVAVVASTVIAGGLGATAAYAAPLDDNANAIYGIRGPASTGLNGGVFKINTDTATVVTPAEVTGQKNSNRSTNALGISADGVYVYSVDNGTTGGQSPAGAVQLRQHDTVTGVTRTFNVPSAFGTTALRGAVSPVNGIFYFSGSFTVYGFNPANDEIFPAGTLSQGSSNANGDFTFGRNGALYTFVAANLYETPASALPTSASSADLPMRLVADVAAFTSLSSQGANGIAFGGNGYVYGTTTSGNTTYLVEYDMARNAAIATHTISTDGNNFVDLASRHFLNTLTLKINLPDGRQTDGDQFRLDITGEGNLADADETTTGTAVGIQSDYSGPVIASQGGGYTVSASEAGTTDLSNYSTSVVCTDAEGANVPVAGSPSAWDLVFPAVSGGTDVECIITATPLEPSISLIKTADTDTYAVGDTVTYTFEVENTGPVALTSVTISDPLEGLGNITFSNWPGAPGNDPNEAGNSLTLLPGETATAQAEYTVTQADVDAGRIANTASVTGTPPSGTPVTDDDDVIVLGTQAPSIALVKSVPLGTELAVGETVTYTFVSTNTGNVTLTGVTITDPLPGLYDWAYNWGDAAAVGTLEPGDTVSATAKLDITESHVVAGSLTNTATTLGTPPNAYDPENPDGPGIPQNPVDDEDSVTLTGSANPALELTKIADRDQFELGERITYTFDVTNTGDVTLSGVTIVDPLPGLSALVYDWSGATAEGVLAPNETVTATATYLTTQPDVDRGFVHNAATAQGNTPGDPSDPEAPGETIKTPPSEVTVQGPDQDPAVSLDKSAVLSIDENTVTYTFVATNIGNVSLTDVEINDPLTGLSAMDYDWSNATAEGVLAPGQFVTGTATYTVTDVDRNAGAVVNLADTVGTPPNTYDPENPDGPGIPQNPVTDEDPAVIDLAQTAAIQLIKEGELAAGDVSRVGDLVNYTFTITNTGNVTLDDVQVTDQMLTDASVVITIEDSAWPGVIGVLQTGQSVEGSASYPLTQIDIDAGKVENVAVATGISPINDPENPGEKIRPSDDDDVTVMVNVGPALTLVKTGAFDDEAVAGDTITYGFTVTNTGNQTLKNVAITDDMLADAGVSIQFAAWPNAEGVLTPGESVTAIAIYTITQADIDAGHVHNRASATGVPPTPPGGETPDPLPPVEDEVDLPTPANPAIELVKTSELAGNAQAGSKINYTFVATNTGGLTLRDVSINDPLSGLSALVYDWSAATAEGVLAPGEWVTATASYTLTQVDVDNGHVDNTAATVGTPPNAYDPEDPNGPGIPQNPVTDDDTTVTPLDPEAEITLIKDGVLDGVAASGGTVSYTFTATNTGDATLTGVTVSDPLPGLSTLVYDWSAATAEGVLAPGERVTATASYTLTQVDVDAGGVVNVATTVGTPPNAYDPEDPEGPGITRNPVTDEDPAFVPTPQGASIQLVKKGALVIDGTQLAGAQIEYTFVATNTGNVTLTDVKITDPLDGLSAITHDWSDATGEGMLAPGETVTGTATYELTQADIDAGHVDNTATVTGLPPVDSQNPDEPREPVKDQDNVTVPITPAPSIALVKTGALDAAARAGDAVTYTFVATNTGNVTLSDVGIEDPLPDLGSLNYSWPGAAGVLQPGQSVTATALYTLTQDDVDSGDVNNTATVIGTPPATYDIENPGEPKPQDPVTDDDSYTIPLPPAPAIELVKTVKATGGALAGDRVDYTFVATNTGNVTLSGVVITDPLPGLSALTYEWPGERGVLAPGEQVRAKASYALTAADVKAGAVHNTATVVGYAPDGDDPVGGEAVTDKSSATILTGVLAATGVQTAPLLILGTAALLLLAMGVLLLVRRKKYTA